MSTPKPDDEIWTTRDGRKIAVGDMTEEHARNTLRLVIRRIRERHDLMTTLAKALKPAFDRMEGGRLELEERLRNDIMNGIGEDKKWGSD